MATSLALICISLMTHDVEHLAICLLATLPMALSYACLFWLHRRFAAVCRNKLSCPTACGIFVPQGGTEPASPALDHQGSPLSYAYVCRSSGWMSTQTLCPSTTVFLWPSCKNSFYIPDTSPDQISDLQIFLPILWVVFSLSWWCPTKQLMFWNLMILFFSFAVISKKPWPNPRSQIYY